MLRTHAVREIFVASNSSKLTVLIFK